MAVEIWDLLKDDNNIWVYDFSNNIDLYGDPNHDVERFIKGRNL